MSPHTKYAMTGYKKGCNFAIRIKQPNHYVDVTEDWVTMSVGTFFLASAYFSSAVTQDFFLKKG